MSDVNLTLDQLKAINHDKGNIIVSASAGSGKTHVVIERIIRLVRDKRISVQKILAVTYTRLAAEEMKEKLKKALIKEFNQTGEIYLKEQIKLVNISDISTIHSFLVNVLRSYFYALNLDATFEVLDARKSKKLILKALEEVFEELYEEGNQDFLKLLSYYSKGRNDRKLKQIISKIYEFSGAEGSLDALLEKSINFQEEVYNVTYKDLKEKDNYFESNVETIKMLFSVTKKFEERYTRLKQEENGIDFIDIERLSLKLFENKDVLNEVKSKYEYIFIDEYQDVNKVQEALINLLSSDNVFMVGDSKQSIYAFRGCNPEYFIEKSNNYSQNNGGSAVFLDRNFRSAKKVVDAVNNVFSQIMTTEFGSNDYVNHKMVYGEGYGDYEGKATVHLIDDDEKATDKDKEKEEKEDFIKGVYSVLNDSNGKRETSYGYNELSVVKTVIDVLDKDYFDIKSGEFKKVDYGDICILARSLGGENQSDFGTKLVKTLSDFNIPVSSGIKNKISSYPEIKALYSAIKAICFMQNDVDLATVMVNFFGFNEDELYLVKKCGDKYESFYNSLLKASESSESVSKKAKEFLTWFTSIRLVSEFLPASEVLRKIISDSNFELKLLSTNFGKNKMQRVERFIAEANFTSKPMSVYEFKEYLDESFDNIEISLSDVEDTVSVMTAHGSKGLEFPIVIVAGTSRGFNKRDIAEEIYFSRECGIVPRTYNLSNMTVVESLALEEAKNAYYEKRSIEEIRLFYVELTRAKCELHIIAERAKMHSDHHSGKFKVATCQSDFLTLDDMETDVYLTSELKKLKPKKDEVTFVGGTTTDREIVDAIKENLTYSYGYLRDTTLPLKTSVSKENGTTEYYKITNAFGESSSEKGTAYHKFLELCSFDSTSVESELNYFLENALITDNDANLLEVEKLKNILNMPIFTSLKGKKVYREKKFCYLVNAGELGYQSQENILIQGIIDLIVVDENGVTLIDYKLSTIESEEDIVKKYSKQLSLYKKAIEKCMKVKVSRAVIVNILQEKIIEVKGI